MVGLSERRANMYRVRIPSDWKVRAATLNFIFWKIQNTVSSVMLYCYVYEQGWRQIYDTWHFWLHLSFRHDTIKCSACDETPTSSQLNLQRGNWNDNENNETMKSAGPCETVWGKETRQPTAEDFLNWWVLSLGENENGCWFWWIEEKNNVIAYVLKIRRRLSKSDLLFVTRMMGRSRAKAARRWDGDWVKYVKK